MTQPSSPTWRRRFLAGGLAAAVAMAGVGVAVAGQGDLPDPPVSSLTAELDEALEDVPSAPSAPVDSSSTAATPPSAEHVSVGTDDEDEDGARTTAPVPGPTTTALVESEASSGTSVSTPSTTPIDPSRIFGERLSTAEGEGHDFEGIARELEAEVRACVADLLDDVPADFDDDADADRIQSFASDVVDEVLACVAGLVDVGQVLGCVGEVIQEIVAVVMTMDFGDLPELVGEIADDVVGCISG